MSLLEKHIENLAKDSKDNRDAIIGDYERPGLKTIAMQTAEDVKKLAEKAEEDVKDKIDWERWLVRLVVGLIIAYLFKSRIG